MSLILAAAALFASSGQTLDAKGIVFDVTSVKPSVRCETRQGAPSNPPGNSAC